MFVSRAEMWHLHGLSVKRGITIQPSTALGGRQCDSPSGNMRCFTTTVALSLYQFVSKLEMRTVTGSRDWTT